MKASLPLICRYPIQECDPVGFNINNPPLARGMRKNLTGTRYGPAEDIT